MELLELEHAVEVLLSYVKTPQTERVPLMEAAGRKAAEDVYAAISNPPFDRSPLDGYTFAAACVAGATAERPVRLRVVGEECAGESYAGTVGAGETVRIMTGGAIPAGCDCVIRQEDVREDGDAILVPFPLRAHENYCDAGEDVRAGTHIIRKGQTLRAADLAVLPGKCTTAISSSSRRG